MKNSFVIMLSVIGIFIAKAQQYPIPDFDNVPYYYDESTNSLSQLEKANYHVETKAKGLWGSEIVIVIPEAAAKLRFSNTKKVQFIIHFDDPRKEPSTLYTLIPLTVNTKNNNNQREYRVKSTGLGHSETNTTQLQTNTKKIGEGLYIITFAAQIPIGEFAIRIEKTNQGYVFGIDDHNSSTHSTTYTEKPLEQVTHNVAKSKKSNENIDNIISNQEYKYVSSEGSAQTASQPSTSPEYQKQIKAEPEQIDSIAILKAVLLKMEADKKAKEEAKQRALEEAQRKAKEQEMLKAKIEAEKRALALQKAKELEAEKILNEKNNHIDSLAIFYAMAQKIEEQKQAEQLKKAAEEVENRRIDSLVEIRMKAKLDSVQSKTEINPLKQSNTPKPTQTEITFISNNPTIKGIHNLFQQFVTDSIKAETIRKEINSEMSSLSMKASQHEIGEDFNKDNHTRYLGDMKNRKKSGTGVFIDHKMGIWYGVFSNDNFVKGTAIQWLDEKRTTYIGECKSSYPAGNYKEIYPFGFGKWVYADGTMTIGHFDSLGLLNGIVKKVEANGNYFFGLQDNGKKNGFGIYITQKGNMYIGMFKNDKLQNGYSSQTDDVGLKSYFEVTEFIKRPIDTIEWENFINEFNVLKKLYQI